MTINRHIRFTITLLITLLVLVGCEPHLEKKDVTEIPTDEKSVKKDYYTFIEDYLEGKKLEPTLTFNNEGKTDFHLLDYTISWHELERGIELTINGHTFNTVDKTTLNQVWGSDVDSVNFANHLSQVKIYDQFSIIGLVLTYTPCTGLGCGVNYQLIYDINTQRVSYFGRFRTGFEFELYDFNSDDRLDYLSKTCYCRNASGIDSTEYEMYSQDKSGGFKPFLTEHNHSYGFKHTYSVFGSGLTEEEFKENWVEQILSLEN